MTEELSLFQILVRVLLSLAVTVFALIALYRILLYLGGSFAVRPRVIVKRNSRLPPRRR